jgi:hypothetical protein
MRVIRWYGRSFVLFFLSICIASTLCPIPGQESGAIEGGVLYQALKKFELRGKASVSNLTLKRDRAEMVFTGDFYFASPINGRVTGAIFLGEGTFQAEAPPFQFEKDNLKRFLDSETVESDFRTAVLRFSDDTFDIIGKASDASAEAPDEARNLAAELEPRLLKETGANISARLLVSLANNESPGIFMAQFNKGRLDRFTFLLDPQARILGCNFNINGGEKILLFRYAPNAYENDIWIATYSEQDYKNGRASYSDEYDLVSPLHYTMEIDLRRARKILRTKVHIDMESSVDGLRALPMIINEGLSEYDDDRLDEAMRIKSAQYEGKDIFFIQEDWESGLTLFLPKAMQKGEKFSVDMYLEGDFIDNQRRFENGYYPQANISWYPRHGFLKRSTFDITFRHNKNDMVASIGELVREDVWPDDKNDRLTQFKMDIPVSVVTFAAGLLRRHTEKRELSFGDMEVEFYIFPYSVVNVKESFILAELGNALDYFSDLFGPYPYGHFRAAVHPFQFGQGFATMLLIPSADEANRVVFSFIAHETSHQWWGNIVAWRSYRDQWLSEGFAEYCGMLYTRIRHGAKSERELIKEARYILPFPAKGDTGVQEGKVAELGSMILGHRLRTRKTTNAYNDLIYTKGALVLRMLHFLFSHPSTGNDEAFFRMMADFVRRYANRPATTENFLQVASEHFAQTPIAQTFGLKDLTWFFQQWVYEAKLPSYRMEYHIDTGKNGQAVMTGTVFQENAGKNWFMPLPVIFKFPGDQKGRLLVYANGPETPFKLDLPMKPSSVELDPDWWILSEKTSTKKK